MFNGLAVVGKGEQASPLKTMQRKTILSLGQIIHQSYVEFFQDHKSALQKNSTTNSFLIIAQKPELG